MKCKTVKTKHGWTDRFHLLKYGTLKIMQFNKDKSIYREIHIWGEPLEVLKKLLGGETNERRKNKE